MDKRLVYIVLGTLVILYLVGRKANPELLQDLQARAVAVVHGQPIPSKAPDANAGDDAWEKHRQELFAARVVESKRCAVAKYPALATADSEMNIRFVHRYNLMVKENSPRLKAYNWPELLADDCAAASVAHGQSPGSTPKAQAIAHRDAAEKTVVAAR